MRCESIPSSLAPEQMVYEPVGRSTFVIARARPCQFTSGPALYLRGCSGNDDEYTRTHMKGRVNRDSTTFLKLWPGTRQRYEIPRRWHLWKEMIRTELVAPLNQAWVFGPVTTTIVMFFNSPS